MSIPMKLKLLPLMIALPLWLSACGGADEPTVDATPAPQAQASRAEGKKDSGHGEAGHQEEGGHEEESGHIALTPEQLKATGITLVQVGPAQIRETLPLYGVIAPNAESVREVAARFPGAIRNVTKKIGDPVREGEALATVEANESLQPYAVTAPLSGVVTARNANPGEQTGDRTLFTVADLSTVWVELSLFPRDVAKVRVGQGVRVISSEAGLEAEGKVVYVAPFGQAANQTLTARVLLNNPERRWAPGLYVTAEVTLAQTAAPLAIRNEAVQTLEGRSVVFVQGAEGFAPREVVLGRSDGEFSEVTSGLAAGDTYAAANSFILKAELGKGAAAHED
ncbi:MAG: efflux RND transporter periplasmic adaptor subunit [Gammaproteobacteria bacterium]|nr:efflux RND transporter periplasmic adaptor subunit [Gammaproteobacteria bacterium]